MRHSRSGEQEPGTHAWHTLRWIGLPPAGEMPAFGDARARDLLAAARAAGLEPRSDAELLPLLLDLLSTHAPVAFWATREKPRAKSTRIELSREDAQARAAAADRTTARPLPPVADTAAPPSASPTPARPDEPRWLNEFSRRPHHSPRRVPANVEALICELRRTHRRWGARRISYELGRRDVQPAPSHATVHRVLVRNGLARPQEQQHKRKYKRWQREAPMHLWQLDLVGGVFLADGRECKMLTGIDDHSRFVVTATVVERPTGKAVCDGFTAAMRRYGVPFEVLTDNGKQFTGRFTRPIPAEVLFERTCREHGIIQRLIKRRSPTTTGKIERWHQTLRRELLDEAGAFATIEAAQAAIDSWTRIYNHDRPHQSLGMATPASLFRPSNAPAAPSAPTPPVTTAAEKPATEQRARLQHQAIAASASEPDAVEIDILVPPSGAISLAGHQQIWLGKPFSGRTVTIWAGHRSVHILLDGQHVKTITSRLSGTHMQQLVMRGARPAGPAPAALSRSGPLPPATVIEADRTVDRHGYVQIGTHLLLLRDVS
jgi:transposase InsO family protein